MKFIKVFYINLNSLKNKIGHNNHYGELKQYKMDHLWQLCKAKAIVGVVGVMSELTWPRLCFISVILPSF